MPRAEPDVAGFVSARRAVKPGPRGTVKQGNTVGSFDELPNRMGFELAG
jgi:hypothetical protein